MFLLPRTLLCPILELDQVPGNPGPLFRLQKQGYYNQINYTGFGIRRLRS